ncbi:C-type lectin domain family 4 member E-like isoform X2 [Embiotoca jacksoni]|uniref:C-type lectin domain family 4 member E-like isoform X2 n=1 Tax=Embiotoca jacksoni TaxID=100190 RepID=UPI003704A93A
MTPSDDQSTDGKSSHRKAPSNRPVHAVRVGSRSLPMHPLVVVCLGLLNVILLLTAVVIGIYCGKVSEEPPPHQIAAEEIIMEVKQLQMMQNDAVKDQEKAKQTIEIIHRSHQQMKVHLERNKTLSDHFQRQLETKNVEKATLQSKATDMSGSCGRCTSGWVLLNSSCYFHAKSGSSWQDSRADCIRRGADLAVIDNWDEQVNLFEFLPKQGVGRLQQKTGGVWIGLSDIQTEGSWVWVNDAPLQGNGYWIPTEPNNYGVLGEDCVALLNRASPQKTWLDGNCLMNKEWLCEREPN